MNLHLRHEYTWRSRSFTKFAQRRHVGRKATPEDADNLLHKGTRRSWNDIFDSDCGQVVEL